MNCLINFLKHFQVSMSKPTPSKRKSIHDKLPLNEIKDNVKNDAIVTRSKTQGNRKEKEALKQADNNMSEENGLSSHSSDEDFERELSDLERTTREGSHYEEQETRRLRSKRRRSASSSNEVDSSSSPRREHFMNNVVSQSAKNELEQQARSQAKIDRLLRSAKKENTVIPERKESKCNCLSVFVVSFVVIFILAVSLGFYPGNENELNVGDHSCEKNNVTCITDNVKTTLKSMQKKYKNQNKDLWKDAYIGIRNIIHEPKKPSIILLLGDQTDAMHCLTKMLGDVSSNALDSGLLKLTPENFEKDMGSVITSVRSSIKDKKAVIIWDLLNINEEALKAFHNLCDRINPLVEEVIYIITIITDDYDKKSNPLEYVEKKLYNKLSGKMKEDAIQPLITRITDGPILTVNPEPDMTDCPRVSK